MTRATFCAIVVAAVVAILVGCGAPSAEPTATALLPSPAEATPTEAPPQAGTPYKIAMAPDVTGTGSFLGEPQRNWVAILMERLDQVGGVVGPDGVAHEVAIIVGDTESGADIAAGLAQRFVYEDEVVAMIMGSVTPTSLAVAEVAGEAEVPYVSMGWSPAVVVDQDTGEVRPWVFKVGRSNRDVAQWQVERLTSLGASSVCYLYENTEYGRDCYDNSSAELTSAGFESAFEGTFGRTDTEFPQVSGMVTAGCDVVVIGAIPPGAALAHAAIRAAMPDIPIIHGYGVCTQDFITAGGEAVEGAEMPCSAAIIAEDIAADSPQKEVFLDFKTTYEEYTGGPVSAFDGQAYDAFYWVLEALETLPAGLDLQEQRTAVREYIESNIKNWPGATGIFNLSPEDHCGLDYMSLTWFRVENQKFVPFSQEEW
jgi:branched-chain amino acid transport system substrate-binding protein